MMSSTSSMPTDSRTNHSACRYADTYPQGHRVGRGANRYADTNSDCYPDGYVPTLHSEFSPMIGSVA